MIPGGKGTRKNMAYSESQILGFVEWIESLQMKERETLKAANLAIDPMNQALLALHAEANASNDEQEQLKRQLKQTTEKHKAQLKRLYILASSQLDMMIGAVEKDSVAAKNFRRIRSRLKRTAEEMEAEPAVQPVPQPVPLK